MSLASLSGLAKCLWVRPGAYPRVEHLQGTSLRQAPALPATIRLGWKSLPGTNDLAYFESYNFTTVKSFIALATGLRISKQPRSLFSVFVYFSSINRFPHNSNFRSFTCHQLSNELEHQKYPIVIFGIIFLHSSHWVTSLVSIT